CLRLSQVSFANLGHKVERNDSVGVPQVRRALGARLTWENLSRNKRSPHKKAAAPKRCRRG
ncbi:MAG: hypothetical protein P4L40_21280, partial [Terracidiphilus sp.]|nr:hypothetical protein [Terracidiphilus sp.]